MRSFQREEGQVCTGMHLIIHFIAIIVRRRPMPGAGRTLGEPPKPTRGQFLVVPDPGVGRTEGQEFAGYCKAARALREEPGLSHLRGEKP